MRCHPAVAGVRGVDGDRPPSSLPRRRSNPTTRRVDTTDYDASISPPDRDRRLEPVYNALPPSPARTNIGRPWWPNVAAVVLTAVQIVHDVLVYLQTLENDCNSNNQSGYLANIDNTTVPRTTC